MARRSATVIVSCIHPAVGGVDARKDFGEVFGTLDYRHIGIGIGRKYVDQNFAKDCFTDEMDDVEEEEIAIEDPLEMSAGRVARDIESMEWTPLLQAPVDLVVVSADRRQPDRPILPLHHADDRERMATTSLLRQMPPGNHSAQLASQVDTSAKTQIDQRAHDHAYRHTTTAHGAGV
ncbi:hypothetical protein E4U30_007656 [Claviceps sp. LM220 group G6]|nr:hypothetical protein E4U30_007656 [Claviceps sp. LM220 group G6]